MKNPRLLIYACILVRILKSIRYVGKITFHEHSTNNTIILTFLSFQNYTLRQLLKHTNYVITLAAKNLKGLGPNATIELRTEDGGQSKV